jgi:hypothetical protein
MRKTFAHCLAILLVSAAFAHGEDQAGPSAAPPQAKPGAIFTLWPLFDYRSSPATGYSNLSILGPIFKRERSGDTTRTAVRPLFFSQSAQGSCDSDILYPVASTSSGENDSDTQVLHLFQKHIERAGTSEERHSGMLFPFYISGSSDKYGPYTSMFPVYGDIYERFWRDEYHFFLFPLYGRTVKKGTTSTNWLYPIFNIVSGEKESGFAFWPLYGQSHKEGVYEKRFALWPLYSDEHLGQDTDNPTRNLYLLPFYASSESPKQSSTYIPWPLCGVVRDNKGVAVERDFLWPFWMTASGTDSNTERYIPFYAESKTKESSSRWVMWPIYHKATIDSPVFRQDKTRLFYFLFHRSDESWPQAGRDRAQSAFWPLYAWKRDEDGLRTLSMPALVEPVFWNDGIERNLAPLWRVFISTWDDQGNGAMSILWNLFWREKRGGESAWELSPLVSYRSAREGSEFKLLKGLFGYATAKGGTSLSILWIPFGI